IFTLDPTQYPKGIDLSSRDKQKAAGIYRFDQDRLIVCFSDPEAPGRPKEFSAKQGSKQMLMTLQRSAKPLPPQQPAATKRVSSGTTAQVLTDDQVKKMLRGTWKYSDNVGLLFVIFNSDGSFKTVREVKEIRLFQKVFVQTPISTGV